MSALLEELKTVATEVKKSQIEDAVGSSWAALAVEEDPQEREIGTLLVKAGAGGEGQERDRGGGAGVGGRGGAGERRYSTVRTVGGSIGNPA